MADAIRRASAIQYVAKAADIQLALNKGGHVYIERGAYITDPLIGKTANTTLQVAPDATLTLAANSNAPLLTDNGVALDYFTLCGGGTLDGNDLNNTGASPAGPLINLSSGGLRRLISGMVFKNCGYQGQNWEAGEAPIAGWDEGALKLNGNYAIVENCLFIDVHSAVLLNNQRSKFTNNHILRAYAGISGGACKASHNVFEGIGHDGIMYVGGNSEFIGNDCIGCYGSFYTLEAGVPNVRIIGGKLSDQRANPIVIQPGSAGQSWTDILIDGVHLVAGAGSTVSGILARDNAYDNTTIEGVIIRGCRISGFGRYGIEHETPTGAGSSINYWTVVGNDLRGNTLGAHSLVGANNEIGHNQE